MSRKFDRTELPALETALPVTPAPGDNKLRHAVRELRALAERLRTDENLPFYSMRVLAKHLQLPLRTVALAIEQLEAEGLLLRLRGSHTKLLGKNAQTMQKIAGVIGMPVWIFGMRHFIYRRHIALLMGDALWQHAISIDTILYWEYEDLDQDFIDRLLRHRIDMILWFQPLRHNLEAINQLKDRGVRSLIIGDQEMPNMPAQILIDWEPAYKTVLPHWKQTHGIRKIILVEGTRHTTPRLRFFEEVASRHGIVCVRQQSSPELAGQLAGAKPLPISTAIALFDDHASTEFSLRNPEAFLKLAERHRILFARDVPSIPFCPPDSLSCERLAYPVREIVDSTSEMVMAWRAGTEIPPIRLTGMVTLDWRNPSWM